MILKTVTALALRLVRQTDAPERPLVFAPPCQSELKLTLRRGGWLAEHRAFAEVSRLGRRSFDADGERKVSGAIDLWFRNGGCRGDDRSRGINRKFTPNRMIAIFNEFSATLPQCKHLRFIDGC
jgi:hypothetical protein